MSVKDDAKGDAKNFLEYNDDMVRESITDGNRSLDDHREFSDKFHEQVVDRSYSFDDALVILKECKNDETDSGLWEGKELEDAIVIKAAFSYANDVRSEISDLYDELKELYDEKLAALEAEYESLEERSEAGEPLTAEEQAKLDDRDNIVLEQVAFNEAWEEFQSAEAVIEVILAPGSEEEKQALDKWFALADKAGMFAGYPMGQSYIDARVGSGHGIPEVKDFVDYDHLMSARLPHLAGKAPSDVKAYYDANFGNEKGVDVLKNVMWQLKDSPEAMVALANQLAGGSIEKLESAFGAAQQSLLTAAENKREQDHSEAVRGSDAMKGFQAHMKGKLSPTTQEQDHEHDDMERE